MPRIRPHTLPIRIAGLLAAGLAVTSCSSGGQEAEREYTVPASLCGTALPASTLEPLLPAGKKISPAKTGSPGFTRCRVVVDGRVAVTSIIERRESGTTLRNVAYGTYGMGSGSVTKGTRYVVSDAQAVGHVACGSPQKEDHETFAMLRAEDVDAGKAAMEKAITDLAGAVAATKGCTGQGA
ncbi:hypothetical protein ACFYVM_26925 [Streptomyces sp. NPDC003280]|uniref:hypothetical protein n=1 Tax=Streptomyces sp. NPDC003280 TaxID=3364680 RepID=UPI00367EF964